MPIIAAGIVAGASYLGGRQRNKSQISSAREQMEFQKEMSNTAHQRQVTDLRAAGLNPILSARYGGASSPGGAQANIQDTITPALNTGRETYTAAITAEKTKKETQIIREQLKPISQMIGIAKADAWLKSAQRFLQNQNLSNAKIAIKILNEDLKTAKRNGQIAEIQYKLLSEGLDLLTDTKLGDLLP